MFPNGIVGLPLIQFLGIWVHIEHLSIDASHDDCIAHLFKDGCLQTDPLTGPFRFFYEIAKQLCATAADDLDIRPSHQGHTISDLF